MKGEKYLFVVSGPSGTGKDTVVAALLKKHPEIQHTVSATTRTPREGEKDGINYHFMSVADFEDHLAHDQIVEHTKYCENYYGTLRSEIEGRMKLASRSSSSSRSRAQATSRRCTPVQRPFLCCPGHAGARAPSALPRHRG